MKQGILRRLLAATALALFASLPAYAGMFDDEEARSRIEKLRGDLSEQAKQLEAAASAASSSRIELANQIEQLKADMAKLRGQIEVLSYELEATQKRQKDFYVDLDNRLRKLETAAPATAATPAATAGANVAPVDPAAEMRDYENALTLFKGARYKDALAAFLGFIKTHASSGLLPSAHYWAASSHFQLREYPKAAELFAKVPAVWPADAKAPDALLGQANSQQESGDAKGAKKTLSLLIEKYPDSNAAQAARQRLKKK